MSCDRTEEISLLIDGELQPAEARSIERHLNVCNDCRLARADFLVFRRQLADYNPLLDPAASRRALAQIVSPQSATTPDRRPVKVGKRNRFSGAFTPLRFNPAFVTVVMLLLTGTIAIVLYRAQQDSHSVVSLPNEKSVPNTASETSPSPSPAVDQSSKPMGSEDPVAENSDRKVRRPGPQEKGADRRKPNSPIKPTRERSAPKPLPQLRSAAPPTYAKLNERLMPASNELASATDPGGDNLRHLQQSELLLRAFRNARLGEKGVGTDLGYERRRAQQLVYQNMLLRREADAAGNIEVATLLGSLEPILLDIANLRDRPRNGDVRVIRERVERQSLVPLLQVSSLAVARSND